MSKTRSRPSTRRTSSGDKTERVSYDKLFHRAFEYFLKDLVELVRPNIAAKLDFESARLVDQKLFADFRQYGHAEPDFVAEVMSRENPSENTLIHIETERAFRRTIDRRMLRYGQYLSLKKDKTVVSIAVFLRGGQPGVERRDVVRQIDDLETIAVRYLGFGLSRCLAEEYVDRPQPLAAALAALMRSERWDRVEQKQRCLRAIGRAPNLDLERRYVLAKIVESCLKLTAEEQARYAAELAQARNKEVREMVVTFEEALAEREALGQIQTAQEFVLLSAEEQIGPVPVEVQEKVRAIRSLDRLRGIFRQLSSINSLDELDLALSPS